MRCSEKRKYSTRKEAKRSRNNREHATGLQLYIYKCPECSYFHLTRHRISNEVWSQYFDNRS